MEITSLRTLLLVAELGSFAAVARRLDVDPSSVSRLVSGLEQELGLRLFQRSTRQLFLTDAGQDYLQRIAPLLDELEAAREDAAGSNARPEGSVRLTASVSFGQTCLVPLLPAFQLAYPGITLELLLDDRNLDLFTNRIDLAIRLAPEPEGDLISTRLMTTRYHVCASPDYVSEHGLLQTPDDLRCHACLRQSLSGFRTRWLFRNTTGEISEVPISGSLVLSNASALRDAAILGLGPALLADWVVRDALSAGQLINLFPNHRVTATSFDTGAWALYPSKRHLPTRLRATLGFLRQHLARR